MKRHPKAAQAAIAALVVFSAGCSGFQLKPVKTAEPPARWTANFSEAAGTPNRWLDDFDSPRLKELVETALSRNHDISAAAARVEAARARARIAGAPMLPSVEAGLDASKAQRRIYGSATTVSRTVDSVNLEAAVSWEADLWDRLGNSARAAVAEAEAAEADYRGFRLLLAANVARNWFGVIEAGLQTRLAERTVESYKNSLKVIEERYRAGLVNALDVRLARENLASAENVLTARRRDHDAASRALETLLGSYPAAKIGAAEYLPNARREVPAGLPSELLGRRPDLVAAAKRLLAAGERLEGARKNWLPSVRVTAGGGYASDEFRNLLDWDNLVWSIIAGLAQPIFQGGRLSAERTLAEADHGAALTEYAQSVLVAFREVETALAAESRFAEQETALERAAVESAEAEAIALERYRLGLTDIVTLLEAQRRAFNAESARLRLARDRLDNRVALYLALGGGFEGPPEEALNQPNAIEGRS